MAHLTPAFAASRTVTEYTEQHHLPVAAAYRKCAADHGAAASTLVDNRNALAPKWTGLRLNNETMETNNGQRTFPVDVFFNDINPDTIRVELYANAANGDGAVHQVMERGRPLPDKTGAYRYQATVSSARPATNYTMRVAPQEDGLVTPPEDAHIRWQR